MKIGVIGMGYVGLTTAAVLAELRHDVLCMDNNMKRIAMLKRGEIPICEPGLKECISEYSRIGRLSFTDNLANQWEGCSVVFITVGTPPAEDGSPDLSALTSAADELAKHIRTYTLVVIKSTVPPGTCDRLEERLWRNGADSALLEIASNPEFLREGTALSDMRHPDRIIAGVRTGRAASLIRQVFEGIESPFTVMGRSAAEMTKYASNAFLATKISFVNELARVCDAFGIDVTEVSAGMGQDARIGPRFLCAGLGYGGSCFPKDIAALHHAASSRGVESPLLHSVQEINDTQVEWCIAKLKEALPPGQKFHRVTVCGAAFKADTDDIRESRAILLMKNLADSGFSVSAYDPLIRPELSGVTWFKDRYDSLDRTDALIIATEWDTFVRTDWRKAAKRMDGKLLFDGRNLLDRSKVEAAGFRYLGVGRPLRKEP